MHTHKIFLLAMYLLSNAYIYTAPTPYKPRVSIITSVYKGDAFIKGFLEDIVQQTIFPECELIIINANSPHNEEPIILKYCEQYPNIIYIRLEKDPGLYGVWNMGIRMAHADLVTNANIDDRRNPKIIEIHAQALEDNPSIDLVYSDFYIGEIPDQRYTKNPNCGLIVKSQFSLAAMPECLPGPFPMWRKSLHDRFGYFDETYISGGDFDLWCRSVSKGAKFKKVSDASGIYYSNPSSLGNSKRGVKEFFHVCEQYEYLWKIWPKLKTKRTELIKKIGQTDNSNEIALQGIS